jgi:hypothetical protein
MHKSTIRATHSSQIYRPFARPFAGSENARRESVRRPFFFPFPPPSLLHWLSQIKNNIIVIMSSAFAQKLWAVAAVIAIQGFRGNVPSLFLTLQNKAPIA